MKQLQIILQTKDFHDYFDIYSQPFIIVLTFILGYVISSISFNKKEKNKSKKIVEYFKEYLENQNKSINKQNEEILNHKNKVEKLKNTDGLEISIIAQPYFILNSINKEDLLESLKIIKSIDPKDFIETLTFIEFTRLTYDVHLAQHRIFSNELLLLRNKWNLSIKDFHDFKAKVINLPIEILNENEALLKLNEVYNQWVTIDKEDSKSFKFTIDNLVIPLSEYFKKRYNDNPQDTLALEVLSRAQSINIIYKEWHSSINQYSKYLETTHNILTQESEKENKRKLI